MKKGHLVLVRLAYEHSENISHFYIHSMAFSPRFLGVLKQGGRTSELLPTFS